MYGAAILSGIGGSTMLVTSLAMCSDLIKHNTVSTFYNGCCCKQDNHMLLINTTMPTISTDKQFKNSKPRTR